MNYNWLKNKEERKQVLDTLMSNFKWRIISNEESLKKGIVLNDEISSTACIIKEFESICVTIWNDSLYENNTYLHLLLKLSNIGKNPFPIPVSEISDAYLKAEEGSEFRLKLVSNNVTYEMKIAKGTYIDFSFLKLIVRAADRNESSGKYYRVHNELMDSGYSFIYLDSEELQNMQKSKILGITELTEQDIDSINHWVEKK